MAKALRGREAEEYAYKFAAALVAGKTRPQRDFDLIDVEALRRGMARYMGDLQAKLMAIPAKISSDPVLQNIARERIVETLARAEIALADSMFDLDQEAVPGSIAED